MQTGPAQSWKMYWSAGPVRKLYPTYVDVVRKSLQVGVTELQYDYCYATYCGFPVH